MRSIVFVGLFKRFQSPLQATLSKLIDEEDKILLALYCPPLEDTDQPLAATATLLRVVPLDFNDSLYEVEFLQHHPEVP